MHPSTQKAIETFIDSPSHGVLLEGEPGSGKSYLAEYIAEEVLAGQKKEVSLRIFDGQDDMGINEVRRLRVYLSLKLPGQMSLRRVIIINNIDRLGHEAQNALLKTFEEPPMDTLFICGSTRKNNILPTISSRLNIIKVRPINRTHVDRYLKNTYPVKTLDKACALSEGQAGLLLALLENQDDHSLAKAIHWAKDILGKKAYERLLVVDGLIKDQNISLDEHVLALQKVLRASINQTKVKLSKDDLKRRVQRLEAAHEARELLSAKVQPKLVFDKLFVEI